MELPEKGSIGDLVRYRIEPIKGINRTTPFVAPIYKMLMKKYGNSNYFVKDYAGQ